VESDFFERKLISALKLELPYERRIVNQVMATLRVGRPAGVLAVFGYPRDGSEPSMLLTRRSETLDHHKGQIAFPGGVSHLEDEDHEGIITTALRETEEEVGIPRSGVRTLGKLPQIWTPTGFLITPIVGVLNQHYEDVELFLNPGEIAEAFWTPLSTLLSPETYRQEFIQAGGLRYATHVYQLGPHRVWGATGAIIKNLLDRLNSLE